MLRVGVGRFDCEIEFIEPSQIALFASQSLGAINHINEEASMAVTVNPMVAVGITELPQLVSVGDVAEA